MADVDAELLALQADRVRRKRQLRLRLRNLRDSSDPFDIDELTFKGLYRLSIITNIFDARSIPLLYSLIIFAIHGGTTLQ